MSDLRIYIGAGPEQEIPRRVLAHSIGAVSRLRMFDQISIDVVYGKPPVPREKKNRARTAFSFQRFMIPRDCGFKGRAIYLDSDMLCLADIAELWEMDMGGAAVLSTDVAPEARNAVLLIDCERARWDIGAIVKRLDSGEISYRGLMEDLEGLGDVSRTIPARWNCLDYAPEDAAILHYTDMQRQPWRFPGHPHEALWLDHLRAAMRGGALGRSTLQLSEMDGHVREGLSTLAMDGLYT